MGKCLNRKIIASGFTINNSVWEKQGRKNCPEENRKSLIVSLLYNVCFLSIILLCFQIRYETNDDLSMATIANMGEEHLIYINIVIGYLLKFLWNISAVIPWYPLLEVVSIFFANVFIEYVLLRNIK